MVIPNELKRVVVVGTSCTGKTTFAKRLASVLETKHIEMDAINWLPEWQERPTSELRELTKIEVESESWVLDGNYSRVRDITWSRATHIVWLNYAFPVVFYRALKRTLHRSITQEELFSGNRESLRNTFLSTDSIILWVLRTFHSRRRRYAEQIRANKYDNLKFLVIESSGESESFLEHLKSDLT